MTEQIALDALTIDIIKATLPDKTSLHYVDYRDDLDESLEVVQKAIRQQDMCVIDEDLMDGEWYYDSEWENTKYYVKELKDDLVRAGYDEEQVDDFLEENEDWIRDIICERDDSDVVSDLICNTSDPVMFYDLCADIDECGYDNDMLKDNIRFVKKTLGIPQKNHDHDSDISMMIQQASYGGRLVIYFKGDIKEMINSNPYNTIQFTNPMIAVINTYNGSGDNTDLQGITVTLPYNPENVFIDKLIKYNYTYEVCGMVNSWCDTTGVKFLSKQKRKPVEKKLSGLHYEIERDEKYKATYKAGGCTFGDMDYNRHRNQYYINDFPCGTKCKDCGTFWID